MDSATECTRDGQRCLSDALKYEALGWSVLALCHPDHIGFGRGHKGCGSPGKRPWHSWKENQEKRATAGQIADWWRQHSNSNVGIALGPVSGLIRVDVEGEAGEQRLKEMSGGDLPDTLEFTSGRGRGLLYAIPGSARLKTTSEQVGKGAEVRLQAKGAQTALPPSRHPSGSLYEWAKGKSPWEREAALAPAWLVRELAENRPVERNGTHQDSSGREKIVEGGRNDYLASVAGTMRRRGLSEAALLAALTVVNDEQCEPPLPEADVRSVAKSVARYAPADDEDYDESPLEPPDHESNGQAANTAKPKREKAEPPIVFPHGETPENEKRFLIEKLRGRHSFKSVPITGVRKLGRGNEGSYELLVDHEWAETVPIHGSILIPANVQQSVAQCLGIVMPLKTKKSWCGKGAEAEALLRLAGIGEDIGIGPQAELMSWLYDWTHKGSMRDGATVSMSDSDALYGRLVALKHAPYFWDTEGRLYLVLGGFISFVNACGFGPIRRDAMIVRLRRAFFHDDRISARHDGKRAMSRMWISVQNFDFCGDTAGDTGDTGDARNAQF